MSHKNKRKEAGIMKRLTSLDEMVQYDDMLEKFEEMSRHGYSFQKCLEKCEDEDTFYDWTYWE